MWFIEGGRLMLKHKKGQVMVEWGVLLAIIIIVILVFLNGPFRQRYKNTLESAADGMEDMANRLRASRPCIVNGAVVPPSQCQ